MVSVRKNSAKRRLVLRLRRQGLPYAAILKRVHIAKSTLSAWVSSGISIEEEIRIKEQTAKMGREKIIAINKARSVQKKYEENVIQDKIARTIKPIARDKLFWLGIGLYLAEGAKTNRWKATFYNSDVALNRAMVQFFRSICGVPVKRLHIQLVLHRNINEIVAREFWSKALGIPQKNFSRASFVESRASKGRRPKNRLPYGTVQIVASGKATANLVKGWMRGITQQFSD